MDPSKYIGKTKEQVSKEQKARRNYPIVWNKIADAETNRFYHPDEINNYLKKNLKSEELCPYKYNKEGESFFISSDMHKALLATCRCGRPRTGVHLAKCLQKALNPYLPEKTEEASKSDAADDKNVRPNVPPTSNSYIGWQQTKPAYYKLEQSMRYVSPLYSMPGPRVTAAPYHTIIIG